MKTKDTLYFFNRQNFYRLQLNYYSINYQSIIRLWRDKQKVEFLEKKLSFLNNETIAKIDESGYEYTRWIDYKFFFWKLRRFLWFSRYCGYNKKLIKKVLLVSEFDKFGPIAMYFAKRYNQQYVLGWMAGIMTNRSMVWFSLVKRYKLGYLFNYSVHSEFTIFLENRSHNLVNAFKELTNGRFTYPFVLYSAQDIFFSPATSFLVHKTDLRVYYYLSFFFACFCNPHVINTVNNRKDQ